MQTVVRANIAVTALCWAQAVEVEVAIEAVAAVLLAVMTAVEDLVGVVGIVGVVDAASAVGVAVASFKSLMPLLT